MVITGHRYIAYCNILQLVTVVLFLLNYREQVINLSTLASWFQASTASYKHHFASKKGWEFYVKCSMCAFKHG